MFIVRTMKMIRLEKSVYIYIFFSLFFLIIIDRSNQAILINYYIEYILLRGFVISEVEIHEEKIVYRQDIVKWIPLKWSYINKWPGAGKYIWDTKSQY